ncbi:MAG: hypothetical protein QF521_17230, partial [Alphaproteobacteria bacterium]|nr:hypothetical protein [Alphaproteobacteria bacterium]
MNIHQYQQIPIDRPWVGVAFACLVSLLLGAGLAFTKFNIDYRVYFSADNPQLIAFEQLQDVYSKQDNIMFVLAPENGNVFTAKMLSVIEKLTEKAWFIPFTRRVDSLTNFQHSYAEEDDLIVENLVEDAGNLDTQALERIRKVALSEILLVNRLVSSKGHVSAINATLQLPGKDLTIEVPEAVAFARKLARDIEANHSGIFGAVCPERATAAALVLPFANIQAM